MSRFPSIILSTSTLLGLLLICPIQSETIKSIPEKSLSHLDPIAIDVAHPVRPETTESTPKKFVSPIAINDTDPIRFETTESNPGKIWTHLVLPIAMDIAGQIPFLKNVVDLWNYAEKRYRQFDHNSDPTELMMKKISILSQKMDHLESKIHDSRSKIIKAVETISAYNYFREQRDAYTNSVWEVSRVYNQYLIHVAEGSITQNSTRITLQNSYLHGIKDLNGMLQDAHYHLYGKDNSLLEILIDAESEEQSDFMCKTSKSIQQMIHEFYRKLIEAEVKVYALKLYLTCIPDDSNLRLDERAQKLAKEAFDRNIDGLTKITEKYLRKASREVWKCNPKENLKGVHYVKFGPIFQKYVMNEIDSVDSKVLTSFHPRYPLFHHDKCRVELKQNATDYSKKEYACKNDVRNCKRAGYYNICPLNKTIDGEERYERYFSVEYSPDSSGSMKRVKAFENTGQCTKSDNTPWGSVLLEFINRKVGTCLSKLCTCNDLNEKHLRFFDLRWVKADNDKVITGIRITPVNNTFYLQIKQGNLLPYGVVNSTGNWKDINPLPPLFYTDKERENKDYMKLTYDRRTFWLGNYNAQTYTSEFEVITGIQFAPITDHSGIRLNVLSKQFDFRTGYLSHYIPIDNLNFRRVQGKPIKLDGLDVPDNPNKKYVNNEELEEGNGVLNLTQTPIDLDFGQNILPFVDIQPVETDPPTPLSGVGLFRRSSAGSGGYLALKLITFDFHTTMKHNEKTE